MDVIGHGTYGCVHKPSLKCQEPGVDYTNKVSKLISDDAADEEMKMYRDFQKVDPDHHYHLGVPLRCKPSDSDENIAAVKKCPQRLEEDDKWLVDGGINKRFSLLIMNDGGIDLHEFSKRGFAGLPLRAVEDFWMEAHRLFKLIIEVGRHGLILIDVKPENIVYSTQLNKLSLIDFGKIDRYEDVMAKPQPPHWSYPPEANFYRRKDEREFARLFDYKFAQRVKSKIDENNPYLRKTFVKKILPDDSDPDPEFTGKGLYEQLQRDLFKLRDDAFKKVIDYDTFYEKSLSTFDLYGVGIALFECLKASRDLLKSSVLDHKRLHRLLYHCVTPDIMKRFTMPQAMDEYEAFLQPLLEERNLRFVNHTIVPRSPSPKPAKKCPEGKRPNKANRCIKIPVCHAWKEWNSDHTKCITRCTATQERTPFSTRCVKRCRDHQLRYGVANPNALKGKNRCVTARCPLGKTFYQPTKRCRKTN